jgi:hypothetical protein
MPTFELSNQAALHMEADSPAQITSGTAPVIATPVRSLWQTSTMAVKATIGICFGMRASGHVQFIQNVAW